MKGSTSADDFDVTSHREHATTVHRQLGITSALRLVGSAGIKLLEFPHTYFFAIADVCYKPAKLITPELREKKLRAFEEFAKTVSLSFRKISPI